MKPQEDMPATQLCQLMQQSRRAYRESKALKENLSELVKNLEYGLQFSGHAAREFRSRYKARLEFEKKEATK